MWRRPVEPEGEGEARRALEVDGGAGGGVGLGWRWAVIDVDLGPCQDTTLRDTELDVEPVHAGEARIWASSGEV